MMKLALLTAFFCLALPAHSATASQPAPPLGELLSMLRAGVPDKAVRAYAEVEGWYERLTAEDVVALREAGAGAELLLFLIGRSGADGSPVLDEKAEVIYEAEGFRVLRQKDVRGREVIVLTNIDENGRRMDRPLVTPREEIEPQPPEPVAEEPPVLAPQPISPGAQAPKRGSGLALPTHSPWLRTPQGMVYVGPFYQFVPSNLPGPGSPWSPVYQVVPVWRGYGVTVYPFAQLAPVYPPGFPRYRFVR